MLKYLSVKNFAILENIEVEFENGMTALTGETGAGKSLLIDAIGLLLGDRASSGVVRTGEEYCEITGLFVNLSDQVIRVLKALDIPCLDKECLIKRQVSTSSANIIKINRQTVTLQDLRIITEHLADIHTQHDTKRLINPESYLSLIDHYDESIAQLLRDYQLKRHTYLADLKAYNQLLNAKDDALEKMDFMRFQLDELEKHNLTENEEEVITQQLDTLKNFDKIFQAVTNSLDAIKNQQALETIYEASNQLSTISSYDDNYQSLSERLKSAYYELDDIKDDLAQKSATLDFDPNELETLENRLHILNTLKRKYRKSIDELIVFKDDLTLEINQFENYDEALLTKEEKLKGSYDALKKQAYELRNRRIDQAKHIETKLLELLKDLELKQTVFQVVFNDVSINDIKNATLFKEDGIDEIDFYLSTNVGESLKPLSKVASGGELSRIMLALKEILIKNMGLSLMIFDEIDTGVSGFVANQVALKMKKISENTQVITITHLPQVAAKADHHYYIYKTEESSRTKAYIKTLDIQSRINELAIMISSDEVNEHALKSAEALLKK
ncbi:MAG: DNA repair protein RecN [Candidatus Izemoplasmataceae bacterium]